MLTDRISGLAVALFGLALFAIVIPAHTEIIDYGWLRPNTVPNMMAVVLMMAGVLQAVFAGTAPAPDLRTSLRAALCLLITVLGVVLIARFGFVLVAPVFSLSLMIFVGERRPLWLIIGALILPALIWAATTLALDRPLP